MPASSDLQAAIAGKTIGNGDTQGSTVLEIGTDPTQPYNLYQYNTDNTYTTQTGSWTLGADSSCHPIINLTPASEKGITLGTTAIHVTTLVPATATTGALFTGTTDNGGTIGTTGLTFNVSIPFIPTDLDGKTLSIPGIVTDNRILFNADGTGIDYTNSCAGTTNTNIGFTWAINSNGSLVMDETKSCSTGEIFTISLLDKSVANQYKTTVYAQTGSTVDFAASPYTFTYK
ncbi:MAG: hypothetical protein B7Y07_11570 [Halothiobacillus sp. 24-54-40]|jgi:hypothetical protein|nr:MAG: hypothetical protein B7Y58_11725 [Halothiobacillus sp. 35-54-62]OYZ85399.1 MAG: hypothetical protein B7Y07_11570 [Halothiobacillus sp. 24-54-40]OZA78839.1 MAG: hypothetical protein B7X64_12025 [Halothiobacillus sp. 39-53-45]HQS03307.1 hypothetical protein [Halothiobacillus sp.]HQS28550.1 hypothetical protein [Halothiobacillus sp.]